MNRRASSSLRRTEAHDPTALSSGYFRSIYEIEQHHWWQRGMRLISAALLGGRLTRPGQDLLDVGCGTGGFLSWARQAAPIARLCGADVAPAALELARERVPDAELHAAPIWCLPFESASFDVVVTNDVLQHVPEAWVASGLAELHRVVRSDGVILVRTNGAIRARRERDDWRVYDRDSLREAIEAAGLRCDRLSYANLMPSLIAVVRRRRPEAPTEIRHGVPTPVSPVKNTIGYSLLRAEARYLARPTRALPFGHALLAVASPRGHRGAMPGPRATRSPVAADW